jgi:hypothetical protein
MFRSALSKVMWVGRATVFMVGLAVILALLFGAVSTVSAHMGSAGLFDLGHNNPVSALSTLTKSGASPAFADELDGINSSALFRGRKVVKKTVTAPPNGADYYDSTRVVAACPSGKYALGGGYDQGTVSENMVIAFSKPTSNGRGWELWVHNTAQFNRTVTAYVICARA